LFEDKVVDHILDAATLKEKEVSKEELQKGVEALEEE
jgi:trigger factor